MPKIMLELKNEPKKGDMLIFNGKEFECRSKDWIENDILERLKGYEKLLLTFDNKLNDMIVAVNSKLKDYHDILQVMTKE